MLGAQPATSDSPDICLMGRPKQWQLHGNKLGRAAAWKHIRQGTTAGRIAAQHQLCMVEPVAESFEML